MKLLWLAPWPHPLDTGAHPVPWVRALAELVRRQPGVELTVLHWTSRIESATDEFTRDGIGFIYLRVPSVRIDILTCYQRRIKIVRTYLRRHAARYDLLHLHGSELQLPAMTAGLPVPQLLTVQGLVSQYPPFVPHLVSWLKVLWTLAGYYERRYLPAIHHFSCRTHWDQALVRQLSPGCTVHYNWEVIRPEFFQPRLAVTASRPQILFLGGTQVMKGFREALVTLDLVRRQVDAQLVIAGQASDAEVLAAVQRAGLRHVSSADVVCCGQLAAAELVQLFGAAQCLLHPSYVDNSPNTICEAQIAGLPVVASDVGGVSSLVEDGVTGLLCTLAPASIAGQVLRLLKDADLRQRLAKQAAAVARLRHDPNIILARTLATYQHVLQAFGRELAVSSVSSPMLLASFPEQ